jgi:hypothetical protein
MSITENKPPEKNRHPGTRGQAARTPVFRRPLVLGAAVAVVALAIGGTVWALQDRDPADTPIPPLTAPLTLPATIGGLDAGPLESDFATQSIWRDRAKAAAGDATVVGRGYGSTKERRQIRVVAGRTDLTGALEFAWAADPGRTVQSPLGAANCTKNLQLVARGTADERPTMVMCWRITPGLSAYGVVIDFDKHPVDADGMAALDATWKAALTGR